jgi:regulator of sirC expression with transglutaminase-like and TPR domain
MEINPKNNFSPQQTLVPSPLKEINLPAFLSKLQPKLHSLASNRFASPFFTYFARLYL